MAKWQEAKNNKKTKDGNIISQIMLPVTHPLSLASLTNNKCSYNLISTLIHSRVSWSIDLLIQSLPKCPIHEHMRPWGEIQIYTTVNPGFTSFIRNSIQTLWGNRFYTISHIILRKWKSSKFVPFLTVSSQSILFSSCHLGCTKTSRPAIIGGTVSDM